MSEKMDKSQTGFVPKLGTHVNLIQEVRRMKRAKSGRGHEEEALFIDFSSAYNTVDREKIYDLLKRKNILVSDEILFMKKMYEMVEF